jgi:tetratricopeptide (TPR) repeat protein
VRARAAALLLLALPVAAAEPLSADRMLTQAVELYRRGKLPEALMEMTSVLEQDPENATAKSYVWTIARRMREREKRASMSAAEKDAAVRRAYELLEERRARSKETLDKLEEVYQRTRDVRGPQELALSTEGMEKYLGTEFESERVRAEAEAYFRKIMDNLTRALERSAFVTRKDHLNAEGTLAYYRGEWAGALKKWEAALAEDPADAGMRRNVENLKTLIARKQVEDKVREFSARAETFQRTGYMKEAARAWEQALALAPKDDKIMQNLTLCRRAFQKEERARELKALTDEGVAQFQAGRPSEAVETWLKVLRIDPGYEQARVWISHVGKRLETAPAAASAAPRPAVTVGGKTLPAPGPAEARRAQDLYREGLLLYAGNEVSKAIASWREALRLDPGLVQAQQALRQAQAEIKYLE